MITVTIGQAQKQLSQLVSLALAGEEVVITDGSTPRVRLTPIIVKRQFGALRGVVSLDECFFDPLPTDEQRAWGETL